MGEFDSAEIMRRQFQLAAKMQRSMFTCTLPIVPGYSFWAWSEPALEVGGDLYHFHTLPTGEILVLVADVAGKGLVAGLGMASLAGMMLAELDHTDGDLAKLLAALNRNTTRWASRADMFTTLVTVLLDPSGHGLRVVNAAHTGPSLMRRSDGSIAELCTADNSNLPLGVAGDVLYQATTTILSSGDAIVIGTDGILSAADLRGEEFGASRLHEVMRQRFPDAETLGVAVRDRVKASAGKPRLQDDATLVCIVREVGPAAATADVT